MGVAGRARQRDKTGAFSLEIITFTLLMYGQTTKDTDCNEQENGWIVLLKHTEKLHRKTVNQTRKILINANIKTQKHIYVLLMLFGKDVVLICEKCVSLSPKAMQRFLRFL